VMDDVPSWINWSRFGLAPRRPHISGTGKVMIVLALVGSVGLGLRICAPVHAEMSSILIAAAAGGIVSLSRRHSRSSAAGKYGEQ
jgi:hypothetical protein